MTASRVGVQIGVALVVLVFAIGFWVSGDALDARWPRFYSVAVFVVLIALAAWEHFLWRLPVVQRTKKAPCDVRGTWRGELRSLWTDSDGATPPAKTVYLVLRQSASSVCAVLLSDESSSVSSLASVRFDGVIKSLEFLYVNTPMSGRSSRSPIHHGSARLEITGIPGTRLHGRYWTDRTSRGELDFVERSEILADDYQQAERAFMLKRPKVDDEPHWVS